MELQRYYNIRSAELENVQINRLYHITQGINVSTNEADPLWANNITAKRCRTSTTSVKKL